MRLVFDSPGITRRELAQLLGLSSASMTVMVKRLAGADMIQEIGSTRGKTGRKAGALMVSPTFALATCHLLGPGSLRSAVVNTWGELKSNSTIHWQSPDQVESALRAAQTQSGKEIGISVIALPLVSASLPPSRSISATSAIGREVLTVPEGIEVISSSNALVSHALRQDSSLWGQTVLCVDLSDGANGTLVLGRSSRSEIDLMPIQPFAPIYSVNAFEDLATEFSDGDDGGFVERIADAERQGDPAAATLCDVLLDQASDLLSTIAEMFKPDQLLVGLSDHFEHLVNLEELRRKTRRKCTRVTNERMAMRLLETTPWTRVSGAGLAAIRRWLEQFES